MTWVYVVYAVLVAMLIGSGIGACKETEREQARKKKLYEHCLQDHKDYECEGWNRR